MNKSHAALALGALLCLAAAPASAQTKGSAEHIKAATQRVDGNIIRANARQDDRTGRATDSTTPRRASALDQINAGNVKDLGLVWSYNLESTRGVEATPLVVDGIMYVTASWSIVHAIDVRTGKQTLDLRPEGRASKRLQGLLRRGQPRRGAAQGQGLRRRLRRPA